MAEKKSQSIESITDHDVSETTLIKQDEEEPEGGVVNLLLTSVVEDQRKMIPGKIPRQLNDKR